MSATSKVNTDEILMNTMLRRGSQLRKSVNILTQALLARGDDPRRRIEHKINDIQSKLIAGSNSKRIPTFIYYSKFHIFVSGNFLQVELLIFVFDQLKVLKLVILVYFNL